VLRLREAARPHPACLPALAQTVRHRGPSGADASRQEAPHPHCAAPSPDGRWLAVADLGCDALYLYTIDPAAAERARPSPRAPAPSSPTPRPRRRPAQH